MKKLAGIIILIVVVVLVAAPYFTGKFAETEINNMVTVLNQTPSQNGTTEILSYERSVFNTTSSYRYTLPAHFSQMFGNIVSFEYNCDINHGITGIDYVCHLMNNESYSAFINEYFEGNDPISMNGVVSLFGGLTQFITIDEIKDLKSDGTTFNLAKTELSLTTDKNFSDFIVKGDLPSMSISDSNGTMTLNKLVLGADLAKIQETLFSGDMNFSIDDFKFDKENETFSLNDLKFSSSSYEDGDNLDTSATFSINEINTADGPFSSIKDGKLELEMNGVNQEALVEYNSFWQEMQMDLVSSLDSESQSNTNPADMMQVLPILEKILTEDLDLDINLSGKLDDQENSMKLSLDLLDSVTMADAMTLAIAPQDVLEKIDFKLSASFDKDTLNIQPQAANTIMNSPLFKESSDSYNIELELGSEIEINDEAMTFEELQMMVMTSAIQ